jgi:hypothetical protein
VKTLLSAASKPKTTSQKAVSRALATTDTRLLKGTLVIISNHLENYAKSSLRTSEEAAAPGHPVS